MCNCLERGIHMGVSDIDFLKLALLYLSKRQKKRLIRLLASLLSEPKQCACIPEKGDEKPR